MREERIDPTTLLVPYTVGALLKDRVQLAEDKFVSLVGGGQGLSGRKGWGCSGTPPHTK